MISAVVAATVAMMPTAAPGAYGLASLEAGEIRTKEITSNLNVTVLEAGLTMRYSYRGGYALAPAGKKLLYVRYRVSNRLSYEVQFTRTDSGILILDEAGKFMKHSGSTNPVLQPMISARGSLEDTVWFYIPKDRRVSEIYIRRGTETQPVSIAKTLQIQRSTFMNSDGVASEEVDGQYGQELDLGPWKINLDAPMAANGLSEVLSPSSIESTVCLPLSMRSTVDVPVHLGRGSLLVEAVGTDGEVAARRQAIYAEGATTPVEVDLRKGKTFNGNIILLVPKDMQIAYFRVTEPASGRTIRYRVSNERNLR